MKQIPADQDTGDAALVIEKPPSWNWKAPTARETDEMRAWIEKTLAVLLEHDAEVKWRALSQLGRLPPAQQRDLCTEWMLNWRRQEVRYDDHLEKYRTIRDEFRHPALHESPLYKLRKLMRRCLPGGGEWIEEWIQEPPRKQGQPRPDRERDQRNARLLAAIRYVNRIRDCFPAGRWPRALVAEVVAARHDLSVGEVEKALRRGAKEISLRQRHI